MPRITSQRQIILDYLQSVKTHPSAETIYAAVRKKMPRISLGTVYRNLENLVSEGLILQIDTEIKRFDGFTHDHHHFICKKCNKIFDVDSNMPLSVLKRKFARFGKVEKCQVYCQGICRKCNP